MSATYRRLDTPVPRRLQYRPKDARGFPVPYIVAVDSKGVPQFAVNDDVRVQEVLRLDKCGLCGRSLDRHDVTGHPMAWFIGAARCFLDMRGAFLDPPMHEECARYALQVCPFIAVRGYRRLNTARMDINGAPTSTVILADDTMPPDQPDVFGLGCAPGFQVVTHGLQRIIVPYKPWDNLTFWADGRMLGTDEWEPDRANMTIRRVKKESPDV